MRYQHFRVFALLFLLLSACSTTATVKELITSPNDLALVNGHNSKITVDVSGSVDNLPRDVFAEALLETINQSELFAITTNGDEADYSLEVLVVRTNRGGAFAVNTWLLTTWALKNKAGNLLWSEDIESTGKSRNLGGIARIRKSAEAAARNAIATGATKLSELELDSV